MSITSMLTPENSDLLATDIADAFKNLADSKNLTASFDLQQGTMVVGQKSNTEFSFDTQQGTFLQSYKKALYSDDDKLPQQEQDNINNFMIDVNQKLVSNHISIIRDKVRQIIIPNSDSNIIPLSNIKIVSIDILDLDMFDEPSLYTIKIGKNVPKDKSNDPVYKGVAPDIIKIRNETGESFDEILKRKKAERDPKYQYVTGVELGDKFVFEVHISMLIDYSPNISAKPPVSSPMLNLQKYRG